MADYRIEKKTLPVMALRGLWLYPGMALQIDAGRQGSIDAVRASRLDFDSQIFLVSQRNVLDDDPDQEDLYSMGVIASIKQDLSLPDGSVRLIVEGQGRARLLDLSKDPYPLASLEEYGYKDIELDEELRAAINLVRDDLYEYERYNRSSNPQALLELSDIEDANVLADALAAYVQFDLEDQMLVLAETDLLERYVTLHYLLQRKIKEGQIQEKIDKKVQEKLDQSQKEYFLREKIEVIKEELGDQGPVEELEENFLALLDEEALPDHVAKAGQKEIDRIKSLSPASPEMAVSMTYMDYLMQIPWKVKSQDQLDLAQAKKILEEDHYGMEDVKDRILEYLAVIEKTGRVPSQILCLYGPPGVGKTSISKSIAKALSRSFVSMRLGGVRDEAEIRGHRRTYVGAMPGKIVKLIIEAGTTNPVFLLDEIDKLSQNFSGDPASALLEVLDPEQNDEFRDHYIDLALDLSDIVFITTANSLSDIPPALLDRMELIPLSGYSQEEKFYIAKDHLLDEVLESHGLTRSEFKVSDAAMRALIKNYTRESGVRELKRMLAKLARRAVKLMLEEGKDSVNISIRNLEDFAGPAIYKEEDGIDKPMVGAVTGLAWTQVGGVTLRIEASVLPGASKLQLTGKLGDVMKESAWAGLTYIRANYAKLGLDEDFYKKIDIHIHIPEGATPKDGPSAGISMASAMVSALTGKKARSDIAMTGEITITGKVLPIGGVKEKLLAAKRVGISKVIFPEKNKADITKLSEDELEGMDIIYVSDFDQVMDLVIIDED